MIAFAVVAVLAVLAVVGGGLVLYGRTQLEAPSATHGAAVTVQVQSGETVDQLAADLQTRGLIRSSFWFGWFAKFKGLASQLRAGQFKLDSGMGASAIIQRLEGAPDVAVLRVTLVEGLTARQMAAKVGAAGLGITADQYMNEVDHGTFSEPFLAGRPAGASLEGFLFPDTYDVPQGTTAHQLVQMQLDDFAHRTAALLAAPPNGLSAYQLVVLASIVEREAQFDDDRPKVASAIFNRLSQGMALQSDATVEYGLGITGREPSADELHQDTPYNTYLHTGLTPTPISNPGLASLQAAAHPAATQFLFWVADGCGHNHYAVTAQQHDQQVAQFLNSPCPSQSP
ncbi:MAG TPA: endolytic transglycosylase MltG [Candidatus Dormibacteraeota bacterium]|nr:endolytic transglycosylase MltG [Candidatus Dormibacteraeota bacterium]